MKTHISILFIISFLLSSCAEDSLDRTIFIPDENDSALPAYTEWGYNSFGAKYERDYFLASNSIVPCKMVYNNNLLEFSLYGTLNYSTKMTLSFYFPFEQISNYKDLIQLNDIEIDIANDSCSVKIEEGDIVEILNISEGKLHFKRTQLLRIDDMVNRVIVSGSFELYFSKNGHPLAIYNGRFDMGITKRDFAAYQ